MTSNIKLVIRSGKYIHESITYLEIQFENYEIMKKLYQDMPLSFETCDYQYHTMNCVLEHKLQFPLQFKLFGQIIVEFFSLLTSFAEKGARKKYIFG